VIKTRDTKYIGDIRFSNADK